MPILGPIIILSILLAYQDKYNILCLRRKNYSISDFILPWPPSMAFCPDVQSVFCLIATLHKEQPFGEAACRSLFALFPLSYGRFIQRFDFALTYGICRRDDYNI